MNELTALLQQYKAETRSVGASVSLLQEVVIKIAAATKHRRQEHPSYGENYQLQVLAKQQRELLVQDTEAMLNRPLRYDRSRKEEPDGDHLADTNNLSQQKYQRSSNIIPSIADNQKTNVKISDEFLENHIT